MRPGHGLRSVLGKRLAAAGSAMRFTGSPTMRASAAWTPLCSVSSAASRTGFGTGLDHPSDNFAVIVQVDKKMTFQFFKGRAATCDYWTRSKNKDSVRRVGYLDPVLPRMWERQSSS